MKVYLPAVIFVAAILTFAARASATTCSPAELVHIAVANITPGIDAASFGAQPKNYYRMGSDKPNRASAMRLISMVLIEQTEDWITERPYMSEESMQLAIRNAPSYTASA